MQPAVLNEAKGKWEQTIPVKDWYSVQDVCTIFHVGGPSVYGAIKRGTLRGHRVNGVAMVKHDNLIAYLAKRSQAPSFDPSSLTIEEIVPEKEAAAAAADMVDDELDEDGDLDMSFLEGAEAA